MFYDTLFYLLDFDVFYYLISSFYLHDNRCNSVNHSKNISSVQGFIILIFRHADIYTQNIPICIVFWHRCPWKKTNIHRLWIFTVIVYAYPCRKSILLILGLGLIIGYVRKKSLIISLLVLPDLSNIIFIPCQKECYSSIDTKTWD